MRKKICRHKNDIRNHNNLRQKKGQQGQRQADRETNQEIRDKRDRRHRGSENRNLRKKKKLDCLKMRRGSKQRQTSIEMAKCLFRSILVIPLH